MIPLPKDDDRLERFPSLTAARDWSLERVETIRQSLSDLKKELKPLQCIALTGSLARLDASPQSDVDFVVVLDDKMPLGGKKAAKAMDAVWRRLTPLDMRRPQSEGVFASATSRQQLCDGPRGVVDEAVDVFGKRMQLLLESQCVLGRASCLRLQNEILRRYARHPFANRPGERWSYLADDLIRYWRSYRVWRHWDISPGNGSWSVRNLKLRHSRLLTYTSMLLACLTDKSDDWDDSDTMSMLRMAALPPLERIRRIDQDCGAGEFEAVCRHYDRFLGAINDASTRPSLESENPSAPEKALAEASETFVEVLDNADQLQMALWRLLRHVSDGQGNSALARLIL